MKRLLIATRNSGKTREFAQILGSEFEVADLTGAPDFPAIDETGASYAENATLKAIVASKHFEGLVVGDDSGLEVDALDGAPGIYSARYAGPGASDAANVAKLLEELEGVPEAEARSARFRCSLALAQKGELVGIFEGSVEGMILDKPRGSLGFGYDPVFQVLGMDETLAELLPADKNRVSHRARAIQALRSSMLG